MNDQERHQRPRSAPDVRRVVVLVLAIVLLTTWGILKYSSGQSGSTNFAMAATGRIGLILAALWLAWHSLRRPARWLPPGFAIACLVALMVLAVRRELIIVVLPALGALLALAALIRSLKG